MSLVRGLLLRNTNSDSSYGDVKANFCRWWGSRLPLEALQVAQS